MTELDHLVVAAHTLDSGVAHVRAALGIEMSAGGAHPRMGTHNCLLRLGPAVYAEVIAIDPAASAPAHPRWFQLDDPALQAELRQAPRLVTWLVRTRDLAATLRASRRPLGSIVAMTRGDLHWQIAIPDDGALIDGGMMPMVLEWPDGVHPANRLPDVGASLAGVEAVHPDPASYRRDLASIGADRHVEIRATTAGERRHLVAHIRTPDGVRTLR